MFSTLRKQSALLFSVVVVNNPLLLLILRLLLSSIIRKRAKLLLMDQAFTVHDQKLFLGLMETPLPKAPLRWWPSRHPCKPRSKNLSFLRLVELVKIGYGRWVCLLPFAYRIISSHMPAERPCQWGRLIGEALGRLPKECAIIWLASDLLLV